MLQVKSPCVMCGLKRISARMSKSSCNAGGVGICRGLMSIGATESVRCRAWDALRAMSVGYVRLVWFMENVSWTGVTKVVCLLFSEVRGGLKGGMRAAARI